MSSSQALKQPSTQATEQLSKDGMVQVVGGKGGFSEGVQRISALAGVEGEPTQRNPRAGQAAVKPAPQRHQGQGQHGTTQLEVDSSLVRWAGGDGGKTAPRRIGIRRGDRAMTKNGPRTWLARGEGEA